MRLCGLAIGVGVLAAMATGCTRVVPARSRSQDSSMIVQDSARAAHDPEYQATLAKYRHDSAIIDSMTRMARQDSLVRRDSLFKLYRLALRPEGLSVAEINALNCVEIALAVRYGSAAAHRIINELRDTVYRGRGIPNAIEYVLRRVPARGELDTEYCAHEAHRRPDSIDGTSLDVEPSPPSASRPGR